MYAKVMCIASLLEWASWGGRWVLCVYAPLPDALTEGTWLVVPLLDCFRKEESYSIITRPTAS